MHVFANSVSRFTGSLITSILGPITLKCIMYTGRGSTLQGNRTFSHSIVMQLMDNHVDASRNVTSDNSSAAMASVKNYQCVRQHILEPFTETKEIELPPAAKVYEIGYAVTVFISI